MRVRIDRLTLDLPGTEHEAHEVARCVASRLADLHFGGTLGEIGTLRTELARREGDGPEELAERIAFQVAREIARAAAR